MGNQIDSKANDIDGNVPSGRPKSLTSDLESMKPNRMDEQSMVQLDNSMEFEYQQYSSHIQNANHKQILQEATPPQQKAHNIHTDLMDEVHSPIKSIMSSKKGSVDFGNYGARGILSSSRTIRGVGSQYSNQMEDGGIMSPIGNISTCNDNTSLYKFQQKEIDKALIQNLTKLGIDVQDYTDEGENGQLFMNMKSRDVIQIYRVFNGMRESGKDRFNEIKLNKLSDFPFFNQQDLENIGKQAFHSIDLLGIGQKSNLAQVRHSTFGCFGRGCAEDDTNYFINEISIKPIPGRQSYTQPGPSSIFQQISNSKLSPERQNNSIFVGVVDSEQDVDQQNQSKQLSLVSSSSNKQKYFDNDNSQERSIHLKASKNKSKLEEEEAQPSCLMMCNTSPVKADSRTEFKTDLGIRKLANQTNQGDQSIESDQEENGLGQDMETKKNKINNSYAAFRNKKLNNESAGKQLGHEKVSFDSFFKIMCVKIQMHKQLKNDVIFEDKERSVSCFFW